MLTVSPRFVFNTFLHTVRINLILPKTNSYCKNAFERMKSSKSFYFVSMFSILSLDIQYLYTVPVYSTVLSVDRCKADTVKR